MVNALAQRAPVLLAGVYLYILIHNRRAPRARELFNHTYGYLFVVRML